MRGRRKEQSWCAPCYFSRRPGARAPRDDSGGRRLGLLRRAAERRKGQHRCAREADAHVLVPAGKEPGGATANDYSLAEGLHETVSPSQRTREGLRTLRGSGRTSPSSRFGPAASSSSFELTVCVAGLGSGQRVWRERTYARRSLRTKAWSLERLEQAIQASIHGAVFCELQYRTKQISGSIQMNNGQQQDL